jgi:hypothetical protein
VHGIRSHRDPLSPVYPTNVPATCARCHNPDYMKGRTVRTDQHARYVKSVHGVALLEKGDLSAPACNDCHGNHGAAPPGVRDISMVCGTCHGRESELYATSKTKLGMDRAGAHGCVACHGNHDIQKPSDAMLSTGAGGSCAGCHQPGSPGDRGAGEVVTRFHALRRDLALADSLLRVADRLGMETEAGRAHLRDAHDQMTGVRVAIHSFDAKLVGAVLKDGEAAAGAATGQARGALRDWRNRRLGMGLSLVVILAMIALLLAHIRRLESGRAAGGGAPAG